MYAERLNRIKPSATMAINAQAKLLKAQGHKVYNFSAGEPDFPTPESIKTAGIKALDENFTRYTPASGIPELKTAVCEKFRTENNIQCNEKEITITNGGKQALYNALLSIINKGDEVIIPVPYWVSYSDQVKLCDGQPVFAETENSQVKAELLRKKITKKTKALILNSPCNPSGSVISKEELKKIAELALEHNLFVISDEVYEKIIFDEEHVSIASFSGEIKEKTITINALSKSYCMTGLRLGYCHANEEIINRMNKIQSQTTSNVCSIVQKMALAALKIPQSKTDMMIKEFRERRDFVLKRLTEMGLLCNKPEGAFYVFPSIKSTGMSSVQFCAELLEKKKVAAVPGEAFGCPDNIRISYSIAMQEIKEGLEKIKEFVEELR